MALPTTSSRLENPQTRTNASLASVILPLMSAMLLAAVEASKTRFLTRNASSARLRSVMSRITPTRNRLPAGST